MRTNGMLSLVAAAAVATMMTMPGVAYADNKNVQCYINDIYVYIRARSLGLWDREQPTKHEEKPAIYGSQETACLGF